MTFLDILTELEQKFQARREFWIRPEGISKTCPLHAAVYTAQDLELAENKEFVLHGIHVTEVVHPTHQELLAVVRELARVMPAADHLTHHDDCPYDDFIPESDSDGDCECGVGDVQDLFSKALTAAEAMLGGKRV